MAESFSVPVSKVTGKTVQNIGSIFRLLVPMLFVFDNLTADFLVCPHHQRINGIDNTLPALFLRVSHMLKQCVVFRIIGR